MRLLIWLCAGSLALLVTSAAAEIARYPMKAGQAVRTGPFDDAGVMGTVASGEQVEVQCQDRGSSVGDSTLWDYIQYDVDGTNGLKKRGWVPDYYVNTGTTGPLPDVKQGGCPAPVSSPADPACIPSPATAEPRLTAFITRGRSSRVTTRVGRTITIRGRLRTAAGAPVPGARICVATGDTPQDGALRAPQFVSTDAAGGFTYRLRADQSRRVWLVHLTRQGVAADSVLVRVRAAVSLRGSRRSLRNGQTLVMRGRLGGGARRGLVVELQARRRGRWQTFGATRTRDGGRYRFTYRFTRTAGVQNYKLRARVPAQRTYPYAMGASRPIRVRVSG